MPGMDFSSATIRNEMAELTSLGLLEQPHTSAGRVPSAAGYRFYVDELMQGAIDIHAHGGSDPFDRLLPEDEVCKDYTKAGMAAVVFKT